MQVEIVNNQAGEVKTVEVNFGSTIREVLDLNMSGFSPNKFHVRLTRFSEAGREKFDSPDLGMTVADGDRLIVAPNKADGGAGSIRLICNSNGQVKIVQIDEGDTVGEVLRSNLPSCDLDKHTIRLTYENGEKEEISCHEVDDFDLSDGDVLSVTPKKGDGASK